MDQKLSAEYDRFQSRHEDIQSRICRALQAAGYLPLRNVRVAANGAEVSLCGRVPSYYMKQVAQTVALNVEGVSLLRNELTVC